MTTIIKKLPEMWRNRSFLICEARKIVWFFVFTFTSHQMPKMTASYLLWNEWKHASGELWETTWGNNRLHALMLVHVHINIVNNFNLADVTNQFVDRKDSRKQTFGHLSQNYIYKIKLKLGFFHIFIFVYISHQVHEMWSCLTFYHSLNRFPKSIDNRISTSWKWYK